MVTWHGGVDIGEVGPSAFRLRKKLWAFSTGVWGAGGVSWEILLAEARRDPRPRPRVRGVRRIMGRSLE